MGNLLTNKERLTLSTMFGIIILLLIGDVYEDFSHGASLSHILLEGMIILISGAGIVLLWSIVYIKSKKVRELTKEVRKRDESILEWKNNYSKIAKGINEAIDRQFEAWQLTAAEKDIAILIIKGLQLKEVGEIRKTSEKTIRGQLTSIYQKSSLNNRSELQAYFLEDLLSPQE